MIRWHSIGIIAAASLQLALGQTCAPQRALQLHQSGDYQGAIREYQLCLAAEPNRPEIRSNLGAVYAKLGRYEEAIEQYREALKAVPPAVASRLRYNLALAYYKSQQIKEAEAELAVLHKEQPTDLNTALLLADCHLRTGEFDRAIEVLGPLEATHRGEPALDYVLGMAMIRSGRVAEGQQRVERILGRGESAEGHLLMGVALFSRQDFPGAIAEFGKAEALNPTLPSLQSYKGQALLFTGDAEGAIVAFGKELVANGNDFESNFYLAQILARRGKAGEARPLLEQAARIRPNSAEVQEALKNGFHFESSGPATGVQAGATAPKIAGIDFGHLIRPTVLVFGSYTCPKLRNSAGELKRISNLCKDRADFRLVYIREAHAEGGAEAQWQSTINQREGISLAPAATLTEKQQHADYCLRKLDLPWAAVIDGMDAPAEKAYDAWPSRVYVIGTDGRVVYNSLLGELDFEPAQLEAAVKRAK